MAPGNIPALAKKYNVRFVFLTRSYDIENIEKNPQINKLKQYCTVDYHRIEDLIVLGNYSTTLTLAYARAMRTFGEEMLKTYFIFLTSDYVMADGSMEGLMRYIDKGYSAICAGNFQVIKEEMQASLLKQIDPETQVLQIKPRELVRQSLQHLHPIVITSMFQQ